jgi:hypothetical protein
VVPREEREKNLASLYTLQPVKPTTSDARKMESGATTCSGAKKIK